MASFSSSDSDDTRERKKLTGESPPWPTSDSNSQSEYEKFYVVEVLYVHNLSTTKDDVVNFFTANATFVRFEEKFDGEELISKTAMMELPTLENTKQAVNDLKGKKLNGQLVYPSRCPTKLHFLRVTGNFDSRFSQKFVEAFSPYGEVKTIRFSDLKKGLCYLYLVRNRVSMKPFLNEDGEADLFDESLKVSAVVKGVDFQIEKCTIRLWYNNDVLDGIYLGDVVDYVVENEEEDELEEYEVEDKNAEDEEEYEGDEDEDEDEVQL